MIVCETIAQIRVEVARARGDSIRRRSVGFVPTMGALHDGHRSLISAARQADDVVVVSIFVNPTQFGAGEDLASYPKPLKEDLAKCEAGGVNLVFHPSPEEMYPNALMTQVRVTNLADTLCGASRPGHFDGVALVVTKLFNIVGPDRAYFGQKDAQQAAVIRQMAADLNQPVEIVVCPIVREPDGLAMSSRNAYLSAEHRMQATVLYRSLQKMTERVRAGERDVCVLCREAKSQIEAAGPCEIDYVEVVDPDTFEPINEIEGRALAVLAVRIGAARLIDNMLITS